MKESISYTFLLNIVIVFIFLCFAIIMGVFSYYKAFRANTIIVNAIEKYEGYNCASKKEIDEKLSGIGYNVPFTPKCKKDEKNCVVDETNKYKVVPYNLDGPTGGTGESYFVNDTTGSVFRDGNPHEQTHYYSYAVTTYMYVDLPIVNQLIKMSFVSRTNTMFEFRNIGAEYNDGVIRFFDAKNKIADMHLGQNSSLVLGAYATQAVNGESKDYRILDAFDPEYNARLRAKFDVNGDANINATDATDILRKYGDLTRDYMTCKEVKSYDNY